MISQRFNCIDARDGFVIGQPTESVTNPSHDITRFASHIVDSSAREANSATILFLPTVVKSRICISMMLAT